jgi:hypothetical protein
MSDLSGGEIRPHLLGGFFIPLPSRAGNRVRGRLYDSLTTGYFSRPRCGSTFPGLGMGVSNLQPLVSGLTGLG